MHSALKENSLFNLIDFSVVVPVFCGAPSLNRLFEEIKSEFEKLNATFEVVFVDDASPDNALEVLVALQTQFPNHVQYISLNGNHGQHKATFCGILHTKGNYIITIDDDLETPTNQIACLIACLEKTSSELIYGIPKAAKTGYVRDKAGFLFKKLLSKGAESNGQGSSFRLFNGQLRNKLAAINFEFVFLDEILHWHVSKIELVEVTNENRAHGKSGYSTFKLVKIALGVLFNYSDFPIKLMIWGGTFSALLCISFGFYHIYNKLFNDVQLGFTSLITAIFFSSGVILFAMGIVGEYLRKIYFLQLGKQNFKIKTSSF